MTLNERIAKAKGYSYYSQRDMARDEGVPFDWAHVHEDAWILINELAADGAYVCVESPTEGVKDGGDKTWRCSIEMPDERIIREDADTMAEAICEAWLEVKE